MRWVLFLWAGLLLAQGTLPPAEQQELSNALAEAGNSSHEFLAALEAHLKKYPKTPSRFELERAITKSAIEIKDNARIVQYGEQVLAQDPEDLATLDAVSRSLVATGKPEKALRYAQRYEKSLRSLDTPEIARWQTRAELDQGLGRALLYQSRAQLALNKVAEAVALAQHSHAANPTAESARALGQAYSAQQKPEACDAFAEAFVVSQDAERTADLAVLRAEWRKTHPDEKGLGDVVLAAHDRAVERGKQRLARLRAIDPNAMRSTAGDFVVSGPGGAKLDLATLRGKVVVLDFWATWCGPCRTQHPLYEQVKDRFKGREDVVFLNINTDEDRSLVAPFLEKNQWNKSVYFEGGLSRLMSVSSIPSTIILNKRGELASRMNGFIPDRFVDSLTERVKRILEE
jgi:thiol-disulfide isomerase/thioredoxin